MLRKIACNATNSGAIDNEGNVYVWGAGKFGLLGQPKQKSSISKPLRLNLKSEKLILDANNKQSYVATHIDFGQYHGAIVVNDINTNNDFIPLLYASSIIQDFKSFLMKEWQNTIKKQPQFTSAQTSFKGEEFIIEQCLLHFFKKYKADFPFVPVNKLKKIMVQKAKMPFKDTVSYNRMFQDLADPNDEDNINLKDFRDQLVGRRCGNGVVFTWGIGNNGRLGREDSDDENDNKDNNPQDKIPQDKIKDELIPKKPKIVKFPKQGTIIYKVSCGNSFTLALTNDGIVYSWGTGNSGGLGLGEISETNEPLQIKQQKNNHAFINIKDVVCGSNHCLAQDQQGLVYSWGLGQGGRLGHDDETGENEPKEILYLREFKIVLIECGEQTSACITAKNDLMVWGVGLHGRLGNGKTSNILKPSFIEDLKDQKIDDISLGSNHAFCLLRNARALGWGSSKDGKLGLEACLDRNFHQPKEIITLNSFKIHQIRAGPFHSLALTEKGNIYSFGNAKDGKLGLDTQINNLYIPKRIQDCPIFKVKKIQYERNQKYPLFEQYEDNFTLKVPKSNVPFSIVHVDCGQNFTTFLVNDGSLYVTGNNKFGQLGQLVGDKDNADGSDSDDDSKEEGGPTADANDKKDEDNNEEESMVIPAYLRKKLHDLEQYQDVIKPIPLHIFNDAIQLKIKHVATGYHHVIAVTSDGIPFAWGRNDEGQLGIGKKEQAVTRPTKIKLLQDKKIIMAACGESHSLFLNELGDVYSCGYDEFGELGQGVIPVSRQGDNNNDNGEKKTKLEEGQQSKETKIELQPKLIKGLESIGFIAAGKNHSVAIRTYKLQEKELKLYSWGCGWYGQTGQGTWHNGYGPKMIKGSHIKEVKFILASCGSKHTIALDTLGKLWYFGCKGSVGIEDLEIDKQFIPTSMELPKHINAQEKFKYIAAGEEHNLAVTQYGRVYGFGKNNHQKISSNKAETIYFEQIENDERISHVMCGASHSVCVDTKGIPYTWGNLANGRCGIKLDYDEDKPKVQSEEVIGNPTVIYFMKVLFTKNQQLQIGDGDEDEDEGIQVDEDDIKDQLTFPVQKALKEKAQLFDEKTFHSQINMLFDIKTELPKAIIRNKQIYEAIFTFLQIHPCYLINWITKTTINRQPKEVLNILKIIFGMREIRNNNRILHTLMIIAKKIFQFEMQTYDLKEILQHRTDSTFSQLFNLIFESQDENIHYIQQLMTSILHKLLKFVQEILKNKQEKVTRSNVKKLFDYETNITRNEEAKRKVNVLIQFLKIALEKMVKSFDPQFKVKEKGGSFSDESLSLVFVIKDLINKKKGEDSDISDEDIDSYILSLLFETMFKKFHDLSFEKIQDYYSQNIKKIKKGKVTESQLKEEKELDDIFKQVFNFDEKRNLVSVFADHIAIYLKHVPIHYTNECVTKLKLFMDDKNNNYRTKLTSLIRNSPIDFENILVFDAFLNSMELANPSLTISVQDLINIYNSLVERGESIFIKDHDEDPIMLLIKELGGEPIQVKNGEKIYINEELLEYNLNLQINSRILIDWDEVTKCKDCGALVYHDLIPQQRFKDALHDKKWRCHHQNCKTINEPNTMECYRCHTFRDISTLPDDKIFEVYQQVETDKNTELFQKILIYLPLIDNHQKNIDKIIQAEMAAEEKKKMQVDYDKLKNLETFKKLKANYNPPQKSKIAHFDDPKQEEEIRKLLQDEYLQILYKKVEKNFMAKNAHSIRTGQYQKLMNEISLKLTTYKQKNNQYVEEFKTIAENAYTGRGSDFLKNEKQDIMAGKLNIKGSKKQQNKQQKSVKKQNAQLEKFFDTLNNQKPSYQAGAQPQNQQLISIQQNAEMFKDNFGFFGKYPLYQLKQRKVLKNIEINGKKLQAIMKKCQYVFFDDGDNGYKVDLIYEENNRRCLICGVSSHEAILETFPIHKDTIHEMRRTCSIKATIQLGNAVFNVFEFVILLNEIKSKTYNYGIKGSGQKDQKLGLKEIDPQNNQI